jgi:hypothetical protein
MQAYRAPAASQSIASSPLFCSLTVSSPPPIACVNIDRKDGRKSGTMAAAGAICCIQRLHSAAGGMLIRNSKLTTCDSSPACSNAAHQEPATTNKEHSTIDFAVCD